MVQYHKGELEMEFAQTKEILNDLLFQYNGNGDTKPGILKVTEAMGGCFYLTYQNEKGKQNIKIDPSQFACKGTLAKYILNLVF